MRSAWILCVALSLGCSSSPANGPGSTDEAGGSSAEGGDGAGARTGDSTAQGGSAAAGSYGSEAGEGGTTQQAGAPTQGGSPAALGQGGTSQGGTSASQGGTAAAATGSVQLLVEPGDDGAALLSAIKGATASIHVTMYLLTNKSAIAALISQHKAGLDVKVLLNQTFPAGTGLTNASVYSMLQAAGVPVEWAPSTFTYTHEKCIIIDGEVAWIMTMNLDQTSAADNREYLAIDTIPADVTEADTIFLADWAGTTPALVGNLLVSPINIRQALVALINSATSTLDLQGEELSDYMIVDALAAKGDAGLTVRVDVADGAGDSTQAAALTMLGQHKVAVHVTKTPYIHAKTIVADGAQAYVGSANFTTGSLEYNRELGLLTSTASEIAKVEAAINTDFAHGTAN